MKTCIFIVGDRSGGKTSIIRSLTGYGIERERKLWDVRSLGGKPLKAFILLSAIAERGLKKHPPEEFPTSLEEEKRVDRNDYDILICPIEVRTNRMGYTIDRYIQKAKEEGFDVKVAIIDKSRKGEADLQGKVDSVNNLCEQGGIFPVMLDATNDLHSESSKIRNAFYPR